MAANVPLIEPDTITAGDTVTFERAYVDYSAGDGWVLTYVFVHQPTGVAQSFSSTADGDMFLITVPAATTASWPAGDYSGQGYVTLAGQRFTVWTGRIKVKPNFAGGPVGDTRTAARMILDNVESVLAKRATQEVLEFTVEGTTLRKASVNDLLKLRDRYRVIVSNEEAEERARAGKATGRRILTSFVNPSWNGWNRGAWGWPGGRS